MYEYHDFLNGNVISCVDSTIIAEGEDDYFDYDDHTAYHYDSNIYYKDLLSSQGSELDKSLRCLMWRISKDYQLLSYSYICYLVSGNQWMTTVLTMQGSLHDLKWRAF